ncbi:MAG: hypothetical protein AAGA97_00905 [Pseudomonadota bacterium]
MAGRMFILPYLSRDTHAVLAFVSGMAFMTLLISTQPPRAAVEIQPTRYHELAPEQPAHVRGDEYQYCPASWAAPDGRNTKGLNGVYDGVPGK